MLLRSIQISTEFSMPRADWSGASNPFVLYANPSLPSLWPLSIQRRATDELRGGDVSEQQRRSGSQLTVSLPIAHELLRTDCAAGARTLAAGHVVAALSGSRRASGHPTRSPLYSRSVNSLGCESLPWPPPPDAASRSSSLSSLTLDERQLLARIVN